MARPLVEIKNLTKHFPIHGGIFFKQVALVHALDDVSFTIYEGETLGVVGESGCGKSTLGKTLMHLLPPTSGQVIVDGTDLEELNKKELKEFRKNMQMIFQDPYSSLNSRNSVGQIIREPLDINHVKDLKYRNELVQQLLEKVGLPPSAFHRFPHEFSGGQRQRIGIARSIALNPKLVVCDEPVSALDVSIQSQTLNLLVDLQKEFNLTYLFIAHDLAVVKHISDRVAVMYLGKIVELADSEAIYQRPLHPYTQALISAIPTPDPNQPMRDTPLEGEVPSPQNPPSGCRFHPRCPYAQERCRKEVPEFTSDTFEQYAKQGKQRQHLVACHYWPQIQQK